MRSRLRGKDPDAPPAELAGRPSPRLASPSPGRKRRSVGVARLLVAIVLVPLTAMTAFGISELSAREHTVHHVTHVRNSLARVDALIALREALHYEQSAADVRLRAVQFGLTNRQASSLFGFSGIGEVISTRASADRTLARLSRPTAPTSTVHADATPIRRRDAAEASQRNRRCDDQRRRGGLPLPIARQRRRGFAALAA